MSEAFEPDLGLFRLPLPLSEESPLAEQVRLSNNPRLSRRSLAKRSFWRRVSHDHFRPFFGPPERDWWLIPDERLRWLMSPQVIVRPPQAIRRPSDVAEALEEQTPQFCLRNLVRYEKDAWVDDLWWTYQRLRVTPTQLNEVLDEVRDGGRQPPAMQRAEDSSGQQLQRLRSERDALLVEADWGAFQWRRGPREPEAAEGT